MSFIEFIPCYILITIDGYQNIAQYKFNVLKFLQLHFVTFQLSKFINTTDGNWISAVMLTRCVFGPDDADNAACDLEHVTPNKWTINRGKTPSDGTGPFVDHTKGEPSGTFGDSSGKKNDVL